jgi:hypothetical protein
VQDEPEVIVLDLHEPVANKYSNRNKQSNDDYGATTLNNAFERHLERQEEERHRRYVTDFRKEMQPSPMFDRVDVERERMYDLSTSQTNGATLELSDDPFYAVYKRKSKLRNDRIEKCYDDIRLRNKAKEEKYIQGNGSTVDIKPDPKYLYDAKKWEKERFKVIEFQIKENSDRRQQQKISKMRDQQEFNDHWMESNKVVTKENFQRKMSQVNMVTDEMHRLESKRVKEYAEARLERERVRKLNQNFNEKLNKNETKKKKYMLEQKHEIKLALDQQISQKRTRMLNEKKRQKLVINSWKKKVTTTSKNEDFGINGYSKVHGHSKQYQRLIN